MAFLCEICGGAGVARKMCEKCYRKWLHSTPKNERPRAAHKPDKSIEERFWEKIDVREPHECWPWKAGTSPAGYGVFFVSKERGRTMAPVFAVELATGVRCPPGREGCHKCDTPACCNPAHIYYGTRQQNVDDMITRGRALIGERHPDVKVTDAGVRDIRRRYAAGESKNALAAEFGIHPQYVIDIAHRRARKHT